MSPAIRTVKVPLDDITSLLPSRVSTTPHRLVSSTNLLRSALKPTVHVPDKNLNNSHSNQTSEEHHLSLTSSQISKHKLPLFWVQPSCNFLIHQVIHLSISQMSEAEWEPWLQTLQRDGKVASKPEATDSTTHETKETEILSLLIGGGILPFLVKCHYVTGLSLGAAEWELASG